jgi:hypothetical protein
MFSGTKSFEAKLDFLYTYINTSVFFTIRLSEIFCNVPHQQMIGNAEGRVRLHHSAHPKLIF